MGIMIDRPVWPGRGRRWSHLCSDQSFAELHEFARRLGVPERGFERDHYDLPSDLYAAALALGAEPVASQQLVRRLHAAGLRRRKQPKPHRPAEPV
ncbi:MAG: DUF4031 domain-containing protein [Geodermatophilaceae bacterium]|nr:DUF4031 domain-containing protein [Geodermatophilaceae bacterium]